MANNNSEIYPLARDEAESTRLNAQHKLLVDIVGGSIAKSIPLGGISSVADVGTGTGIWLLDAQAQITTTHPPEAGTGVEERWRTFHGFDISASQFLPDPETHGVSLSVHDILQRFPEEHRNRYDLVHVRMLVTALKVAEYEVAVRNLVEMLKPGGYLQWTDLDSSRLSTTSTSSGSTDPRASLLIRSWLKFHDLNGLSTCPGTPIESAYRASGLRDISSTTYPVRGRAELTERAQAWEIQAFSAVLPPVLLSTGEVGSPEEAGERAKRAIEGVKEYFDDGEVLDLRFGVVVGRKAA
ncbi:hypothetical protein BJX64DRAFT_301205 [Aspergillus heterothallicus]